MMKSLIYLLFGILAFMPMPVHAQFPHGQPSHVIHHSLLTKLNKDTFRNRLDGGECFLSDDGDSEMGHFTNMHGRSFPKAMEQDRNNVGRVAAVGNISFVDGKVKAICVDNWDKNGDGELSYEEAALVKSLDWVFTENTQITSFDELQYFTGLSKIETDEFWNCNNLSSIIIPPSVTSIGDYAFGFCQSLPSITIPSLVASIGYRCFQGCYSLSTFKVSAENPYYFVTAIGVLYTRDKRTLVCFPMSLSYYRCNSQYGDQHWLRSVLELLQPACHQHTEFCQLHSRKGFRILQQPCLHRCGRG